MDSVVYLPTTPRGYELGAIVQVERDESRTVIVAATGDYPLNALLKGPQRRRVTLLAGGRGYSIPVDDPSGAAELAGGPILGYRQNATGSMLWYHDFTTVYAIDSEGPRWRSERLVLDDLQVGEWNDQLISGRGSAIPGAGTTAEFIIDALSGRIISHDQRWDSHGPGETYWSRSP